MNAPKPAQYVLNFLIGSTYFLIVAWVWLGLYTFIFGYDTATVLYRGVLLLLFVGFLTASGIYRNKFYITKNK